MTRVTKLVGLFESSTHSIEYHISMYEYCDTRVHPYTHHIPGGSRSGTLSVTWRASVLPGRRHPQTTFLQDSLISRQMRIPRGSSLRSPKLATNPYARRRALVNLAFGLGAGRAAALRRLALAILTHCHVAPATTCQPVNLSATVLPLRTAWKASYAASGTGAGGVHVS